MNQQKQAGPHLPPWLEQFLEDASDWAKGRMWIPRAILLAYLVYADIRFLRNPLSSTMFSGITLAFHEMGHLIFNFAGHFIGSFMGSGMQVLVPLIVIACSCGSRITSALPSAGSGSRSASSSWRTTSRTPARWISPLVGFSDDPEHDWHYLLSTTGLLNFDTFFAFLIRVAATLSGVASLALAIWLLMIMARTKGRRAVA